MKKTIFYTLVFICLWGISNAESPKKGNSTLNKLNNFSVLDYGDLPMTGFQNNLIYPVWGFYFSGSGGASQVLLDLKETDFKSSMGAGFSANIGFFRAFGPNLKIITGLGLDLYSGVLTAETIGSSSEAIDFDSDAYIEKYRIDDLNDEISPMYFTIPIIFELGNTTVEKTGFYFDLGTRISYLLSDNHSNSGRISTSGTYPQHDVVLGDFEQDPMLPPIPELGFVQDMPFNEFAEIADKWPNNSEYASEFEKYATPEELSKINISLQVGVGATFPVASGDFLLKTGLVGYYGLTDISGNQLNGKEQYMRNTFAAGPFSSKTLYVGFEIALYLNKESK